MNSAPLPTEDTSSKHRPSSIKKLFILIIIILAVAGSSVFAYEKFGRTKTETKHYFPAYISKDQMTIPAYYPVNLPSDFKINNDYKVIQKDVLYYSVSNRAGDKFYITIQKLPTSFDFVAFKKKFVKPDEYNTPIGSNMVGPAGASLIGSIQTTKSVWIILNSTALGSTKDMETITRSLQEVPL